MKITIKLFLCILVVCFFIASNATGIQATSNTQSSNMDDFDPLVDIHVTVEIQKIRTFDKYDKQVHRREYVDRTSDPDFFVKIIINNQELISDIWQDTKYIYDPQFSATVDVPDEEEFVNIKIQLWDWNDNGDVLCDIGGEDEDVEITYSIKTGHWTGDDQIEDPSGYGRLNGCDDGSIYRRERDCELWFDVYYNDYDNDGIPYRTEVNVYGTDPETDDRGSDSDGDDIPIEWEWKWGYDPLVAEDHRTIDPEGDSIDNYEEFLTADLSSDPYRKDLFTELDQMEQSPQGEESLLPEGAKELLYTAFNRQNLVYHLDDGSWDNTGSDMIPFDESTSRNELNAIYQQYFIQGNHNTWRRGVFHYGVIIYQSEIVNGNAFGSNRFQISSHGMEEKAQHPLLERDIVYASAYMHETGHTLGFWPIPGHNDWSKYFWQIGWWLTRPYKSCMNYGYMYYTVDYSDGSRRFLNIDLDDWTRMDLTYFEGSWN
jgi:hypothetical protein